VLTTTAGAEIGFVIAYHDDGSRRRRDALRLALASLRRQTDSGWHAYLCHDGSRDRGRAKFLAELADGMPGRLTVLGVARERGLAGARNVAIRRAADDGCPLLAYLDPDDLSHPRRVASVREMFAADPELDFVYTGMRFIDESSPPGSGAGLHFIDAGEITPRLRGRECWREQAVERELLALPSAMNLRTRLALRYPFPEVPAGGETATLFRYLGSGAKIDYADGIACGCRLPSADAGWRQRRPADRHRLNEVRCRTERAGLADAVAEAVARNAVDQGAGREVLVRYLLRLSRTVTAEGSLEVGREQLRLAATVDAEAFGRWAHEAERDLIRAASVGR